MGARAQHGTGDEVVVVIDAGTLDTLRQHTENGREWRSFRMCSRDARKLAANLIDSAAAVERRESKVGLRKCAEQILERARREATNPEVLRRVGELGSVEAVFDGARGASKLWSPQGGGPESDDLALTVAASLIALGHKVRLVLLTGDVARGGAHVYVEVWGEGGLVRGRDHTWVALDPLHDGPMGSVYDGCKEVVE